MAQENRVTGTLVNVKNSFVIFRLPVRRDDGETHVDYVTNTPYTTHWGEVFIPVKFFVRIEDYHVFALVQYPHTGESGIRSITDHFNYHHGGQ